MNDEKDVEREDGASEVSGENSAEDKENEIGSRGADGEKGENSGAGESGDGGDGAESDEKLEFRGLGEKAARAESKWENFWYYNKWKVIIGAFFAVLIGVTAYQILTKESMDINVMYAGPGYLNAVQVDSVRSALRSISEDYNGDGKIGAELSMLTCLTEEQIEERHQQALAESRAFVINRNANTENIKQFNNEIGYGESVIYMIDPSLYERVHEVGGFMLLEDIFTEEELRDVELYDSCGIILGSLKFSEVNSVFRELPPDTVLCIRKLTAMSSAFKNKSKAEARHNGNIDAFRNIVLYEYPEGWETTPETDG